MRGTCFAIWPLACLLAACTSPIILSSRHSGRCAADTDVPHIVPFLPFLATQAPVQHLQTTWRCRGIDLSLLLPVQSERKLLTQGPFSFCPETKKEFEVFSVLLDPV